MAKAKKAAKKSSKATKVKKVVGQNAAGHAPADLPADNNLSHDEKPKKKRKTQAKKAKHNTPAQAAGANGLPSKITLDESLQ